MRTLLLANNWVGWQLAVWLGARRDEVVGLVVHPSHRRKYGEEILSTLNLPRECVFDGAELRQPAVFNAVAALKADLAVSVFFDYILGSEFIEIFPAGVINLHPSLLPCNRGSYPNVWSIVDGTPAGVTLHYIDTGVDTGDLIAQQEVAVEITDTGETLYRKLERACVELFKITWPLVIAGQTTRTPQPRGCGTYHRASDVERIDRVDLDRTYQARELINILRARSFPPYDGAYFLHNGQRILLRLQLYSKGEQDAS